MIDFGYKVQLGCLDEADPDLLRAWRNDYRIWKYCRQNDLIPKNKHLDWYDDQLRLENPTNRMYAVMEPKKNMVVGVCGLTGIDVINHNAEFSLYIAPQFHKQGFGKRALKTLISHGFANHNLEVIWGESYDFNPARQMFKSIGMKEEGLRRNFYYREGVYVGAYLYSILRQEWDVNDEFNKHRKQTCST